MSDLNCDIENMVSRLKHFGIREDKILGVKELDPDEVRSLLRRAQYRIEELEDIVDNSQVNGSAVLKVLHEEN